MKLTINISSADIERIIVNHFRKENNLDRKSSVQVKWEVGGMTLVVDTNEASFADPDRPMFDVGDD